MVNNYKKNRSIKLQTFCTVVENGSSLTEAAKKLGREVSNISSQIKSLEYDLGYDLFEKAGRKKVLTPKGRAYYEQIARDAVNGIAKAYNQPIVEPVIKIKKTSIIKILMTNIFRFLIKQWNKMLVKITLKRIFFLAIFVCGCTYYYLERTNYFFDKKMESLANPFLKEIIQKGQYRISENQECWFEGRQVSYDLYELLAKITSDKKYKDLNITMANLSIAPGISTRFTGKEEVDKIFNDKKHINCHTEKAYAIFQKIFRYRNQIFEQDSNARMYNLYYDSLKDCVGCDVFFDYTKKYPGQFIAVKIEKPDYITNVDFRVIKYGYYYYLLEITNLIPDHNYKDKHLSVKKENYIFWKKLTLNELMHYDSGSYWKLIKDYNIKID